MSFGSAFGLCLFTTSAPLVREARAAGIDSIVVDWESRGKEDRQRGFDTQVNGDSPDDLRRVREAAAGHVLCRVNQLGPWTEREVEEALAHGASEILLPMVRTPSDAEAALRLVAGRAPLSILVETAAAVACARDLARLPLARVYVGLNDLMIDRGSPHLFRAIEDGTVDRVRECFDVPFGFAGLTLPELGSPLPCRLLVAEMARLGCAFTFLRRSFLADVRGRDVTECVRRIRAALTAAATRTTAEVDRDRRELLERLAVFPRRSEAAS